MALFISLVGDENCTTHIDEIRRLSQTINHINYSIENTAAATAVIGNVSVVTCASFFFFFIPKKYERTTDDCLLLNIPNR